MRKILKQSQNKFGYKFFIHSTMWPGYAGTTMNVQIVLTTQKILPKFCYPEKSFNHPHHLKSRAPPPFPTALGANDYIADWYHKVDQNKGNEVLCNHLFPIKNYWYTVDIGYISIG